MPLRPQMDPREYLELFLRRKWLIIFSLLFILFGASVYCVVVPEQYKSSTTILVVPQRVPEGYVRSTISIRIEERLSTIRQQVLSRTRLVAVMDELGLFKAERKKVPVEEVVEDMRKRIDIQVRGSERAGDKGNDVFTLSFIHENPQVAMLTASRLASFFIDENLKTREQQAVGTSEFLENQLQSVKVKLEEQEEKVKRYKMTFMGELPQQVQANLQALSRFQDQMKANADSTRAAEDRKVFFEAQANSLESQLTVVARSAQTAATEEGAAIPAPAQDPLQLVAELESKRARLADLSARYTDRYPEVVRIRAEVAQLEKRIEEGRSASPSAPTDNVRTAVGASSKLQPLFHRERDDIRRLRTQASGLDLTIASLKKEREAIQKNIALVNARVERSPKREQEMISLTRDYENLKQSYDELLKKKLDADVAQNMEKRQKGEQFQILDPANLPEEPFRPDRRKIFGIALLAALAVGFGGVFVIETLDPTLRQAKDFRHFFDLPILAAIPAIRDTAYLRRQKVRRAAVLGGLILFTAAVSVFFVTYAEKIRAILFS